MTIDLDAPPTRSFIDGRGRQVEEWRDDRDVMHRVGAPARKIYRHDGSLSRTYFHLDGLISRFDGPATTWHAPWGEDAPTSFYVDGNEVGGFYGIARALRSFTPERAEFELARTPSFGPYLRNGTPVKTVVNALAMCVTLDGVLAMIEGAPAEWVRSFEAGVR